MPHWIFLKRVMRNDFFSWSGLIKSYKKCEGGGEGGGVKGLILYLNGP